MQVIADHDKNLMFFKQVTPKELEWLDHNLTWYSREGTLKGLKPGAYVQEQQSKRVGKFKEMTGEKTAAYTLLDGTEKEEIVFSLVPVAKETLLYKNGKGVYYTLLGLKKLIETVSEHQVIVENPIKNNYAKVKIDKHCLTDIELEDFQVSAVQKALTIRRGIIISPTGSGKTEIMLAIIKYILDNDDEQDRVVIITPTILLAEQFQARSIKRGFNKGIVGVVSGSSKEYQSRVMAFTMASLLLALRAKKPEVMQHLDKVKHLFIDEGHHLRCASMTEILRCLPHLQTLIPVSGSPFTSLEPLKEPGDALMWGLTGGPIVEVPAEYLIKIGMTARPVVHMKKLEGKLLKYGGRFQKIYDSFIVKNQTRTQITAKYAARAVDMGFKVLILVQRLPHAALIMNELQNYKVISIFGNKTSVSFNDDTGETVVSKIEYNKFSEDFEAGGYDIAIGSTVADEGLDLPSIGFAIMAGAGKSRIKILQRLGRGVRKKKVGQNVVYVLDFQDRGHVYLNAHSNSRVRLYKEAQADVIDEEIVFWQRVHIHAKQLKEIRNVNNKKEEASSAAT